MYDNFDVIIIFDAMRYDIGSIVIKNSELIGQLKKVNTGCSTTYEWYLKYWHEKNDRHLISENPIPFHQLSNKAAYNFKSAQQSFGDTWLSVNPQRALDLYQNTPVLIHLLPPHLPFFFGEGARIFNNNKPKSTYHIVQEWGKCNGFNKLKKYYKDQIVGMVNLLYENLHLFGDQSEILLTADHGELIGNGIYDHPPNSKNPQLTEVPYFIIDVEQTLLNKRLKALGY